MKLKVEQIDEFAVPLDSFVSTYTRGRTKKAREMPEKMTLTTYLTQRGVKAKALTRGEAALLGIPYPLPGGWPRKYGAMIIEVEMLPQLTAHAEAARQVAEEKARNKKVEPRTAVPDVQQLPLAIIQARTRISPFPGFVLRRPKSYRARKSAPCTASNNARRPSASIRLKIMLAKPASRR